MKRLRHFPALLGSAAGIISAVLLLALGARASDHRGPFIEEFHQTYPITPDGRIDLDNLNGPVHISAWDRNEVKVDAVKSAYSKERLDEAQIIVDAGKEHVSIRTQYPDHDHTFNWGSHDNPASVEYTLTVPRPAALDEIKLVNRSLDITGASGEVHASCINGRMEAKNLAGRAELSTINGRLDATFDELPSSEVELKSVNGALELTIPSDSRAEIEASTISGEIDNNLGLDVSHHGFVGHDLRGELGSGGTHIKLEEVNGRIEIRHADDGRALSPVKDLGDRDNHEDEL
jgi:DUF4097 and DUF4098 domain-containing protein YvlB